MGRPEARGRRSTPRMPRRSLQRRRRPGPTKLSSVANSHPSDCPPWLISTPWVGSPFERIRAFTRRAADATGSSRLE
eukprot:4308139-Pyramimonas_sp.AAC.1